MYSRVLPLSFSLLTLLGCGRGASGGAPSLTDSATPGGSSAEVTLSLRPGGTDYEVQGSGEIHAPINRSVVFQDARLLPWARVLDNVVLGLRTPNARALGVAALAEVGLAGRERAWPIELRGANSSGLPRLVRWCALRICCC